MFIPSVRPSVRPSCLSCLSCLKHQLQNLRGPRRSRRATKNLNSAPRSTSSICSTRTADTVLVQAFRSQYKRGFVLEQICLSVRSILLYCSFSLLMKSLSTRSKTTICSGVLRATAVRHLTRTSSVSVSRSEATCRKLIACVQSLCLQL